MVLGERTCQIAEDIGMSESRLSIIINSPLFKLEIKRLEEMRDNDVGDVTQTLRELSPIALEVVERTMHRSPSPRLRFDAAESILDRAGYGKVSKAEVRVSGGVVTANLSDIELRKLVEQRVNKLQNEIQEKEALYKKADDIEIEFEKDECSVTEQKFNEPRNEVYPLE